MRKLTKIVASALVAATALSAALPAQAQAYPRHDDRYGDRHDDRYGDRHDGRQDWGDRNDRGHDYRNAHSIGTQIEELRRRVERADSRDRVSEREAAGLRNAVYRLRQQYREYSRNGLSRREAQVLQSRIVDLRQRLRFERRDGDGRRW